MKEYTVDDLLEARERRVELIDSLLRHFKVPLLVMRVNYPGLKKTNDVTLRIMDDMSALICKLLGEKVWFKSLQQGAEGPIFLAAIKEEVFVLKRAAIDLEENHALGRCLDIDVYNCSGRSISRQELGYSRRKCYLCDNEAHHCVRSRRHSEQEVIDHIEEKYRNYKSRRDRQKRMADNDRFRPSIDIASLAVQAMLYEISCQPSPGLVSKDSKGAHNDMDYFSFLDSATSLIKPLIDCVECGYSSRTPEDIFREIRRIGQLGEQQMFQKTSGVNTYKGMLFLLGICCAAGGKVLYSGADFSSLQSLIKDMTKGLVERELRSRYSQLRPSAEGMGDERGNLALTHGERLFINHNVEGIRGEVERGLPTVFDFALGFYKENQGLSQNDRLVQTLLAIMQYCEDSNILHRHSFETLKEVQDRAKYIISIGGVKTLQGIQAIEAMNEDFCNRKISPGGSADLLGVTVFLYLLEDYIETNSHF